jgi:hypothetical protein
MFEIKYQKKDPAQRGQMSCVNGVRYLERALPEKK